MFGAYLTIGRYNNSGITEDKTNLTRLNQYSNTQIKTIYLAIYMYLIVAKLFEKRKEKKVHAYIQTDLVNSIILSYSGT